MITDLNVGGAELMLRSLVGARTSPEIVHRVATLLPNGAVAEQISRAGTKVTSLEATSFSGAPAAALRLAALIRDYQPHIVQGWLYHGDLAALAGLTLSGRRRRTGLIWSIRCSDMDLAAYGRRLRTIFRTWTGLSALPDLIVANSAAGLAAHRRRGCHARATRLIYNGTDVEKFKPDPEARRAVRQALNIPESARVLIHVARVDPMKDHGTLLACLANLPDVTCILVGLGTENLPEQPNLRRLGLRDDVHRLMAAADLIASSSAFGEGFSNVLAEGMSCGVPAVATDVGDAREIIGETGIVVPPRAPDALRTAIQTLLADPAETRISRGERARERIVQRFSLARAARDFSECYAELGLRAHRPHGR